MASLSCSVLVLLEQQGLAEQAQALKAEAPVGRDFVWFPMASLFAY